MAFFYVKKFLKSKKDQKLKICIQISSKQFFFQILALCEKKCTNVYKKKNRNRRIIIDFLKIVLHIINKWLF